MKNKINLKMDFTKYLIPMLLCPPLIFLPPRQALAQFDDEMSDNAGTGDNGSTNFDERSGFGGRGRPPGTSENSGLDKNKDENGLLDKNQKNKIAQASLEEINDKNFPELIDSFDYNNAEITDVIKAISELTGKNFIIDPAVRGKITIIAPTKITVAEAYRAFLSALAITGYTIVPSGGFLKVKSSRAAQRDNIETYSGSYFPNSDQMITRIIHLKHISAEQVSRELRILNSKDGELSAYPQTNSLILSDYGANIERVMKIINQLDVPGFEEKLVVIPIKYAKSKDIAELINKIVNKDSSSNKSGAGSFSAGVPRFGGSPSGSRTTQGGSGSAYFMVIPDDRTNSLIVVGNTQGIDRVRKLISQLDFKIRPEDAGGVYVYYVKFGEAEKIAQTLNGIAKDNKPATGGSSLGGPGGGPAALAQQEVFGGDVKIAADKETNSLIITASKQDYEVVLNLLSKIDRARDQVFVEAIILELGLEEKGNYGVGYFKFDKESGGVGRAGFNGIGDITSLLSPAAAVDGALLGFGSKTPVEITTPAGKQTIPDLVGFLKFLKTVGHTNVLSTPQILALNNEEAEIEVGQEVATSLSTNTGANGITTSTPTFKDATLKLSIKPFISPTSDQIRMKVEQKTGVPVQGSIKDTLSIAKRSIKTNIVVPDGDTAVLGGLVDNQETESVTKIPVLGDIPILGWLFKSRTIKKTKVNLLVLLTPKIIRSIKDNADLRDKKLSDRIDFIKQTGGRDPFGKKIDTLPRRVSGKSGANESSTTNPYNADEPIRTALEEETPASQTSEETAKLESEKKAKQKRLDEKLEDKVEQLEEEEFDNTTTNPKDLDDEFESNENEKVVK